MIKIIESAWQWHETAVDKAVIELESSGFVVTDIKPVSKLLLACLFNETTHIHYEQGRNSHV